jgi:prophage regulatory protein
MTANEVLRVTGYKSRSTLWRKVKADLFPPPIKLGGTAIRWKRAEIEDWIAGEPRQTYQS